MALDKRGIVEQIPVDRNGVTFSSICTSSGYLSASGQVVSGDSVVVHVEVITDGVNAATAVLHDGTSAAGTELFHAYAAGTDIIGGGVNLNIRAADGIYLALTGSGAKAIVHTVTFRP